MKLVPIMTITKTPHVGMVYDLTVAKNQSYCVGSHSIVVHNSLCETRIRTGTGVPQVSALAEVSAALKDSSSSATIIADGGVKYPGDVVKALWFRGVGAVMSGYMFAGTTETPGTVMKKGLFPQEHEVKIYRGSASHASKVDRGEGRNIEGNIKEIPYRGSVGYVFQQIEDGVKSGFSYVGARDQRDFIENATVIRVTQSGIIEARPNLLG